MTEWTSIGLTKAQKKKITDKMEAEEYKGSVGDFLVEQVCHDDTPTDSTETSVGETTPIDAETIEEITSQLDNIEAIATEAAHTTQSNQTMIEDLSH